MVEAFCHTNAGTLGGITTVVAKQGVVAFQHAVAACVPGGNLTMGYAATLSEPGILGALDGPSQYALNQKSVWTFRPCRDGERLSFGTCVECSNSTYLLTYDPSVSRCKPVLPEAAYCYGDVISLLPGYWRERSDTDTVFPCPYGAKVMTPAFDLFQVLVHFSHFVIAIYVYIYTYIYIYTYRNLLFSCFSSFVNR